MKSYEYKGFKCKVKYDESDKLYIGDILNISDFISFHSYTKNEIEERFHNCIDNYLEMKKEKK